MTLRKIDEHIELPDLASFQIAREWHSIHCTLATPLHGGGVKARESDTNMPIRVTEIRGQLRFWWRMLAEHKWKVSDLRTQEFALWGGMSDGEEGGKASLVFLRVKSKQKLQPVSLSDYSKSMNDTLGYALFTARATRPQATQQGLPEMKLGKEGFEWQLEYAFDNKITEEQKQQVLETLRWFVTLGGLGGRTRRGCGAFSAERVKLVSEAEMKELGCKILFSGSLKNAKSAWIDAITEWKEIRKGKLKPDFKAIEQQNNRHLATVFSKPVKDNDGQWRGMIIVLPNSSTEIQKMFGGKA